jgi:serine/threonine-protein kinase HipA
MKVTLELFLDQRWQRAGVFAPDERTLSRGIAGSGIFEYDLDYTVERLDNHPYWRAGLGYPVSFELFRSTHWPAFLLDIMPTGAGRRVWLRRLGLTDGAGADWDLLRTGSGNPPGNIRVAEAVIPSGPPHPGFSRDEIVARNADFIEYAEERGAVVTGATDVQGDAPKFLLVRDRNLRWHPDGALADEDVFDSWMVKFPRGRTDADRQVLRNEAPYLEVARRFGLRVGRALEYCEDALFIPRFDRITGISGLERLGFETLSSVTGINEFGKRGDHSVFCHSLAGHSTDPLRDLREYLRRDILNAALRNTDNHGRNTALLKFTHGVVELSPLYDFAPMFLDPEGIPRSSRWSGELEPVIGRPCWAKICDSLVDISETSLIRAALVNDAMAVERLPETMQQCGVEDAVIERVADRCGEIAEDLRELRG